jgi:hypothetical protein
MSQLLTPLLKKINFKKSQTEVKRQFKKIQDSKTDTQDFKLEKMRGHKRNFSLISFSEKYFRGYLKQMR